MCFPAWRTHAASLKIDTYVAPFHLQSISHQGVVKCKVAYLDDAKGTSVSTPGKILARKSSVAISSDGQMYKCKLNVNKTASGFKLDLRFYGINNLYKEKNVLLKIMLICTLNFIYF